MSTVNHILTSGIFDAQVDSAAQLVRRYTVPLFRRESDDIADFEGSGVLVEVNSEYRFVFTAAHVLRALTDGVYLLAHGREQLPLSNPLLWNDPPSNRWTPDLVDVGAVRLTEPEAAAIGLDNFLPLRQVAHRSWGRTHGGYLALGFPIGRQKRSPKDLTYLVSQIYFWGVECDEAKYKQSKVPRRHNLLFDFDAQRAVGLDGKRETLNLTGMSGGGLWLFDAMSTHSPDRLPALGGVLLAPAPKNKKAVLFARIHLVILLLSECMPELREILPDIGIDASDLPAV